MRVYTQGSFDILHSGHINLFKKCRLLAGDGEVVVAVLSDKSYEKYRGYKAAKSFNERKGLLEACKYIDQVIESDPEKTRDEIDQVKPDIVIVGSDWASKDIYKQYHMKKKELAPILVYQPYTTEITTTMIKERIVHGTK
jgi:glycerol-3-phosphate cytidylyltransferase